ncbi:MAG: hypothetical protein WD336_08115 [Trueperaceae bacterium]
MHRSDDRLDHLPDLADVWRARARIREAVAALRIVPSSLGTGRAGRFVIADDTVQATGAF